MTRKDYRLLAAVVAEASETYGPSKEIGFIRTLLADRLKEDNAWFDRAKFIQACGGRK